jgi:hypothetical protein
LDVLLRSYTLRWHYRSHDERLIGFSNAWIYDHLLTTFPGIAGDSCLQHVLVQQTPTASEQDESVTAEVQRVVQLALDHARTQSEETLGVITMGIKHADRIDQAIRQPSANSPTSSRSLTSIAKNGSSSRTWSGSRATSATPSSCRSATARTPPASSSTASAPSSPPVGSGA